MVIGLDCAEPDLVLNRWLTKSAAYEAGPGKTRARGLEGLQIKDIASTILNLFGSDW